MDRLDKFLCDSGAGTRSQVKAILKAGRVMVDGAVEKDGSRKIDPQIQTVALDGEALGGKRRRADNVLFVCSKTVHIFCRC